MRLIFVLFGFISVVQVTFAQPPFERFTKIAQEYTELVVQTGIVIAEIGEDQVKWDNLLSERFDISSARMKSAVRSIIKGLEDIIYYRTSADGSYTERLVSILEDWELLELRIECNVADSRQSPETREKWDDEDDYLVDFFTSSSATTDVKVLFGEYRGLLIQTSFILEVIGFDRLRAFLHPFKESSDTSDLAGMLDSVRSIITRITELIAGTESTREDKTKLEAILGLWTDFKASLMDHYGTAFTPKELPPGHPRPPPIRPATTARPTCDGNIKLSFVRRRSKREAPGSDPVRLPPGLRGTGYPNENE